MPVIEQAKGILMAQQRCGPDEAFDLLRRASQRANIKVSVLAAHIVEQVASPAPAAGLRMRGQGPKVKGSVVAARIVQSATRGIGLRNVNDIERTALRMAGVRRAGLPRQNPPAGERPATLIKPRS
jgi:hypothetical protein